MPFIEVAKSRTTKLLRYINFWNWEVYKSSKSFGKSLDTAEAQTTEDIEAHVNEFNRLAGSLAEANKKLDKQVHKCQINFWMNVIESLQKCLSMQI